VSWALTILGIVVLIVLHELGHFTVAKLVGMRVERFSLFFPPTLLRVRRGDTEYALGAIPAGGYVKITGMNPEELGALDPELVARAYYSQPPWKRIAVILAGPLVNIAIAFLLFWVVLVSANFRGEVLLGDLDHSVRTLDTTASVQIVERSSPAYGVLKPGDRILAVDGKPASVSLTREVVNSHRCAGALRSGCLAATPVLLTVRRGGRGAQAGKQVSIAVRPRYDAREKRMLVGFGFQAVKRHFSAGAAAGAAIRQMWHTTTETVTGFEEAFTSKEKRHELSSIVGITQAGDENVSAGTGRALVFLGYLSLILAVINLFPFLPLDGGHVLWSLAEKVRGRRVSLMAMYRFSSVGIVLLLFLVLNGVSNDISRLAG
jgi:regulator of sigma E protease